MSVFAIPVKESPLRLKLSRALERYFKLKNDSNNISYEFLRKDPTKTGIASSKYYLWVKLVNRRQNIEGAARVSLVRDGKFYVTHFLSKHRIRKNPKLPFFMFPKKLIPVILKKSGVKADISRLEPTSKERDEFLRQENPSLMKLIDAAQSARPKSGR